MTETTRIPDQWNEESSQTFLDTAELFVPGRKEQTATLLQLIPAEANESFTIAELAAGEGHLAEAILEAFPHCHYVALDGSEVMRNNMQQRLARIGDRLEIRPFDIFEQGWRTTLPTPLRCVVSSLCVHHLPGISKRQLFIDMATRLETGGALLLADIIEPANARIARLFAQQYDEIVKEQSIALRGDLSGFEQFEQTKWNYFAYDYATPDTTDFPSRLDEQLQWLHEAGFALCDCFWMRAGHAVYGGFK